MSMQAVAKPRRLGPLSFYAWSVVIGVVGALGAVVFRGLIALFHNLLFLGQWSFVYDANAHTPPGPWGPFVILVPVLGAAGVAFLVSHFAPEAKGHGVPEVMDAIYYNKGVIRPVVAVDQVAGLGAVHRQRRVGRPRGAHRPDRLLVRLHPGPDPARAGVAAHHPDRRRRRGRHRRHLQHADRRRAVRRRDHAPRGQRPHPRPRHDRHGDGVVRRPAVLRQPSVLRDSRARDALLPRHQPAASCCFTRSWACCWGWSPWSTSAPSTPSRTSSTGGSRGARCRASSSGYEGCWGAGRGFSPRRAGLR